MLLGSASLESLGSDRGESGQPEVYLEVKKGS